MRDGTVGALAEQVTSFSPASSEPTVGVESMMRRLPAGHDVEGDAG
jgi:hypothetical protein